jgi:hypothetical protein
MQNATKLHLELLRDKYLESLDKEWDDAISKEAARGWSLPGGNLFTAIQDIGTKGTEEFVKELLQVEEDALKDTQEVLSAKYFDELADELIAEVEPIFQSIRAKSGNWSNLPDLIRHAQAESFDNEKKKIKTRIKSKTKILQDKYQRTPRVAVQTTPKEMTSNFATNKDIFLAHVFAEKELIDELKRIIVENNYRWKEGKREDLGSISEDILTKIKNCGFFVAVMTKKDKLEGHDKFTTSSWLIEEKGAALAFGHRPLIMVEEGIERHYVGFLQSDDEMIYFNRDSYRTRMIEALKKIDCTYQKFAGPKKVSSLYGEVIREPQGKLFYIDEEGRHLLPDEETANTILKSGKSILSIDLDTLQRYPTAPDFESVKDKGTPLRILNGKHVFVIIKRKRYHLSTYDFLIDWGRSEAEIKPISEEELRLFPKGKE